jgi:hypothetical protein
MAGIRWTKEMKITKERLLQIIREEVELHEKYVEENVLELDEEALEELSKQQGEKAIKDAIKDNEKAKKEDMIIKHNNGVIKPKNDI